MAEAFRDPWLTARMANYRYIRAQEMELQPAVEAAIRHYLNTAVSDVLGDMNMMASIFGGTAFAGSDDDPPDLRSFPDDSVWRQIVERFIAPVTGRIFSTSYSRTTELTARRTPATTDFAARTWQRLSGFPKRVYERFRTTVNEGLVEGIPTSELRDRIGDLAALDQWDGQANTMTRTEVMTSINAGEFAGALDQQTADKKPWTKTWLATNDTHVRTTHRHADQQRRPLQDPFTVGKARFQFPGDPEAPPEERMNCRCSLRYAPADGALTASTENPMTTTVISIQAEDTSSVYSPEWRDQARHASTALTAASGVAVDSTGRWHGALGILDEWSADARLLAAPADGGPIRVRPLPLPMLVQTELASGHDKALLGLSRIDRIWTEGGVVMGEGQFDMEDPLAKDIARKVSQGFMRFVSLDVDDATENVVCLADDGRTVTDCEADDAAMHGRFYSDWRVMGVTLLAHPAFPDAFIAMADAEAPGLIREDNPDAPACVKPQRDDQGETVAWVKADCQEEGAVRANAAGDGPAETSMAGDMPQKKTPIGTDDDGDAEDTDRTDDDVNDAEEVEDDGNGCVIEDPDSETGWRAVDCDTPGAIPADESGTMPAEAVTETVEDTQTQSSLALNTNLEWAPRDHDWDGSGARQRFADWATTGDSLDPGKMSQGFLIVDGPEDNVGSYKFGVADSIDGSPKLVWNGVVAAKAALSGARTPTTVPANQKADAAKKVDTLYAKAAEAFDDPAIKEKTETGMDTTTPVSMPLGKDFGHGCLCEGDDGTFAECPCDNPDAVPSDENGKPAKGLATDTRTPATITAAGATRTGQNDSWLPDGSWFYDPDFTAPTPITVDPDTGRISGHLAVWGTCHVGFKDTCITPPRSVTNYDYFHTAPLRTTDGDVYCGVLTMDTGHASLGDSPYGAVAHYDDTGTQAAVVRVGEDNHGIWVAGSALPFLNQEQLLRLSLASFSGDWRQIRGGMELVAALAVNSPGFPMPGRRTGENNRTYALVAAGALPAARPIGRAAERVAAREEAASTEVIVAAVLAALDERDSKRLRREAATAAVNRLRFTVASQKIRKAGRVARSVTGDFPKVRVTAADIELAENWVDKQGGLPPYIKRIADELKKKGMDQSRAIATAVNVVKKMCSSGDTNWPGVQRVNAGSKAKACAAVTRWEAMKAAARAD